MKNNALLKSMAIGLLALGLGLGSVTTASAYCPGYMHKLMLNAEPYNTGGAVQMLHDNHVVLVKGTKAQVSKITTNLIKAVPDVSYKGVVVRHNQVIAVYSIHKITMTPHGASMVYTDMPGKYIKTMPVGTKFGGYSDYIWMKSMH